MGKNKHKELSLFVNNMIIYVESPKESTQNTKKHAKTNAWV